MEATMKVALCEWERNGYDDSDFFVAEYDTETQQVTKREIGSTRYAGGMDSYVRVSDPAHVRAAIAWLAERLFIITRAAAISAVEEPDFAPNGERLRLLRDVKHKGVTYAAGTVGTAFWCDAFGTFYRNGYKTKSRFNLRVGLTTDEGEKFFAALSACRLDREPESDDAVRVQATRRASAAPFTEFFGGAWATHNFALEVIAQKEAAA